MLEKTIILKDFEAVKKFVDIANEKPYDIELLSGKYVVNAKSIMGVFSLDLTKPIVMVAHTDSHAELLRSIAQFEYVQVKK
ncbi:MAG: HPr family phosphocarrier protein [Clostridia bacterium]|nr:HPr family phosphocarrier protein [Clostridia bacterium]MBQ8267214.1 HPr family phosphocarrier protein [Clostridia bacterium]